MPETEIYFDGYCPESLLEGKQVEMRLNEDDFWESEATGLQICISPPYATILNWRGKGKFRSSSEVASDLFTGLILTEAQTDEGKEIFPDEEKVLHNAFEIDWHTHQLYKSKEEMDAAKFKPNNHVFEKQLQHLNNLVKQDLKKLINYYELLRKNDFEDLYNDLAFRNLHELLYQLEIIFNFKWMAWHSGWKDIRNNHFDYSTCSFLQLSMYLTTIFREDHFNEGTIERFFKNG